MCVTHMTFVWTLASMLATSVDPQRVSWKTKPDGGVTGTGPSASTRCLRHSSHDFVDCFDRRR